MLYYPVWNEDFIDEAKKYDAEFSDDALDTLYEYLDDCEEYIEMDMVRIKNEWTEYDSWKEASQALLLMNNEDVDIISAKEQRKYVMESGYPYLICGNDHILVKNGVW